MGELQKSDINALERQINELSNETSKIQSSISGVENSIRGINQELNALRSDFVKMMDDRKKADALQRATTEVVRIRQEIEKKFGKYNTIRETMLGVLQATDVAIVRTNTISQVSEELMLSTPKYWLAPCLVAVSAWIGNDRDLAERAIKEAVKRDEERTALTMALICRRNNRVQTCYEWLAIYFAKQSAASFSEGSFAYIDAYVNGVFGPDEKHMCDDYVEKWLNEVKGSDNMFENKQQEKWKNYCEGFTYGIGDTYPHLKNNVVEFSRINDYVGRITSAGVIQNNFNQMKNAYIDQEELKEKIDRNLINLISRYDKEEEPLRKEEEYFIMIKKYDGDKEKAKAAIEYEEKMRKEQTLNIVQQMSKAITSSDENVMPSQKKTAISFLGNYIKKGFNNYIAEKKDDFPEAITISVNGWNGTTSDGANYNSLCSDYDQYINNEFSKEIEQARSVKPQKFLIGSIALGIISVILLFVMLPLGVVSLAAAVGCFIKYRQCLKNIETNVANITKKYDGYRGQGKNDIAACINEWNSAKDVVDRFDEAAATEIIA